MTALSLSALISNGEMRGGGAYYIISRAVGPELGGAIGACFYFSYSVGCCFYMVSTAESVVEAIFPNNGWPPYSIHLLVGSVCLWIGIVIAVIGAHCFTKVNVPLFAIQFGSILWGVMSIFFSPDPCIAGPPFNNVTGFPCGTLLCTNGTSNTPCGSYHGWSMENFANNAWFGFTDVNCNGVECSWLGVYAVVFTAVTGIFEGANLSGDLRDPNRHIWRGTLIAIWGAFFTYFLSMFSFAGGFDRATLQANLYVLQDMSFGTKWIIVVGIWVACFTSGLGGLMGGSRILQAIARDGIYPGMSWAGRGFGKGDEPRLAVLLTGAIAQVCLFIGGLDAIAPVISTFFAMSYSLVNLSLLLVAFAGTPNFRPRFKYWHWTTALIGFLSNFVMMWALSWMYALIACGIFFTLVIVLSFTNANRTMDWGDIRMALVYHQVRKFLLRMDPRNQHGKLWRPSVLLLTSDRESPLLQACNYLKRGGIFVVGDVIVAQNVDDISRKELSARQLAWMDKVADAKVKAFSQILIAPSARFGYHNLVTTSGLGALIPNTVAVPMWGQGNTACETVAEYLHVLRDAAYMEKNVVIACNFEHVADMTHLFEPHKESAFMELFILPNESVETWGDFSQGPLGSLTLAWGLQKKRLKMRLTRIVGPVDDEHRQVLHERLVEIVKRKGRFRIGKRGDQIFVVSTTERLRNFDDEEYYNQCNATVKAQKTPVTNLVFLPMPNLNMEPQLWLTMTQTLVSGLGPTFLTWKAPDQVLMSRKL